MGLVRRPFDRSTDFRSPVGRSPARVCSRDAQAPGRYSDQRVVYGVELGTEIAHPAIGAAPCGECADLQAAGISDRARDTPLVTPMSCFLEAEGRGSRRARHHLGFTG